MTTEAPPFGLRRDASAIADHLPDLGSTAESRQCGGMKLVHKAVAAVVRGDGAGAELLVFRHPLAGVQLPKGTVEPDETPAEGVLRELEEESGLRLEVQPRPIGEWRRVLDGTFGERATGKVHLWHLFVLDAPEGLPDSWTHDASGSPEEDGLSFEFHWLAIDAGLLDKLHPVFGASIEMLIEHLDSGIRHRAD